MTQSPFVLHPSPAPATPVRTSTDPRSTALAEPPPPQANISYPPGSSWPQPPAPVLYFFSPVNCCSSDPQSPSHIMPNVASFSHLSPQ
jgi:hypothetical protein